MVFKTEFNSKIGKILMVSDGESLLGLWLFNQKYFLYNIKENLVENNNLSVFNLVKDWLKQYFDGKKPEISNLPFNIEKLRGTDFQKNVWRELLKVSFGETITYGEMAGRILKITGKEKMSARAVGTAIGHNPLLIIIPCHRVVSKTGLGGYAAGIDTKIKLLEFEKTLKFSNC